MTGNVDAERWREAGALFHEVVELDEPSRAEWLARLGTSDPGLRAAVGALLAGDAIADAVLPRPGFGLGAVAAVRVPPTEDPLALVGRTIGRFRVLAGIASGGMGAVYRAEDTELHRVVALKFPLLDPRLAEPARTRMFREARAAGALDHANICPIYDVGESGDGPFFVMPLYRGETLKARLARGGRLPRLEALGIAAQLAAGLACAHAAGIVHQDVKPGNVMLLPEGAVKLLDFGLAGPREADASIAHGIVGTIHYMSPEQLRGGAVDARADLWALGVVLHEMLAGARPFAGESTADVLHAILEAEPRRLRAVDPTTPADLDALLRALLEKDPMARPAGAGAVCDAIDAIMRGAAPMHSWPRAPRPAAAVAGVAVIAIAVSLGAVWLHGPATLIGRGRLSPRDTLVLADVLVAGPDSTLGPILTTVLRRDFADSRAVTLMPIGEVRSTLERMHRPPASTLSTEVAREVAQREGAPAIISAHVAPLGAGYVVTLRVIDAEHGEELASTSATAAAPERDLLPALARAGQGLRERIGESLRHNAGTPPPSAKLTTTSLAASRLLWNLRALPTLEDKIAAERAAIALDSGFAYVWLALGNQLDWLEFRSAMHDSALTTAYRLRDHLTLMERAQVSGLYWNLVQRDRGRALAELQAALSQDTTIFAAVPLNVLETLFETRQYQRGEALARRVQQWHSVGARALPYLAQAQRALGDYSASESTLARFRLLREPRDAGYAVVAARAAMDRLRFGVAESLLVRAVPGSAGASRGNPELLVALLRVQGRLAEARRMEVRSDSAGASIATAAGARFDPTAARALDLARTEFWLRHDPAAALKALDRHWNTARPPVDVQDRIDGADAAALYAAVGVPARARALLDALDRGADTVSRRATYEHRQTALAEIALADGRFGAAMDRFRQSDTAADGLPATPCAVCVLPQLARTAERAGWADSAQAFWSAYVSRPAVQRLTTDQWFLAMAYRRLGSLAAGRNDDGAVAHRRRLADLLRNADVDARP